MERDIKDEIVTTLINMYTNTSNEERITFQKNENYNKLVQLSESKLDFIENILLIFRWDYDLKQKLSVSLFFKSYISNLISKKELTPEERKLVYNEMIKIIFDVPLHDLILKNLQPTIESLLLNDEADDMTCQHLVESMFIKIEEASKEMDPSQIYKYNALLNLYKIAVGVIHDLEQLADRLKSHADILSAWAEKLILGLKESYENKNQENAFLFASALLEWWTLNKEALSKMCKEAKEYSYIEYLTFDSFINIYYDIAFFAYPNESVYFDSGNSKMNEIINCSKSNIIKILSTLITVIRPHLHYEKLQDTRFIKLLHSLIQAFLSELAQLGQNPEVENLMDNKSLRDMTTNILTCCAQMAYIKEFHEVFTKYGLLLLTDIGFPFLRTSKAEIMEMHDNPSEFVKLALDVWDRQKFNILKSQSAKFIETIGDKVPGMFKKIAELCLDVLLYAITKEPNMDLYPTLNKHNADCKFFTYCSDEDLIDVSLLTITMISYALPKQEKLKTRFIDVWEKITRPIMERDSTLLNCRLTIMLGYYIDILYKKDESIFFEVISMFIQSLTANEENYALAFQSADTLNTIINDNDIIPRITPFINELLEKVSECIIVVEIPDFFEFISEIFKFYRESITKDSLILIIRCIVRRILNDVNMNSSKESKGKNPFQVEESKASGKSHSSSKSTIIISRCWSIIIDILKCKEFIETSLPEIEEELKVLFGLLWDPNKIDFDDDIIKWMKIIISNSRQLSDTMKVLFPYMKNSFEKHKFLFSELFDLIKVYWKSAKEFVFSSQDNINNIFGFGVQTLFTENRTVNGAVYLIQLFLMLKRDESSSYLDTVVPEVIEKVISRIKEKPMNKNMKRILYQIILASIISNYKATIECLEQSKITNEFIREVIAFNVKRIDNTLERKLLAVSLTNLLTQEELPDSIREKSPEIISKIVKILVRTSIDEAKKAKKNDKKIPTDKQEDEFDDEFDSDSDFSDSDGEGESEGDSEDGSDQHEKPNLESLGVDKDDNWEENDSTDSNEGDDLLETEIDIQSSFSIFKTGFNTFDEFDYFKKVNLYSKFNFLLCKILFTFIIL